MTRGKSPRAKKKSSKGSLIQDLKSLLRTHRQLLEELESAIYDLEHYLSGGKTYYALDFHLLHDYAYPYAEIFRKSKRATTLPTDEDRVSLAEYQSTLSFLFYGMSEHSNAVLLPPHVTELKNHLRFAADQADRNELTSNALKTWGPKLLTDRENRILDAAWREYSRGTATENLPKSLRQQLIGLIVSRFFDVMLLISGHVEHGLKRLQSLIEEDRVLVNPEFLNDYSDILDEVLNRPVSKFYDFFSRLRRGIVDENERDAELVETIIALNERFKKETPPNKRMFLLSNAPTMDHAFHPARCAADRKYLEEFKELEMVVHPYGADVQIYRSTNIFLLFLMSVKGRISKSSDRGESSLEEAVEKLKSYREMLLNFRTIDHMLKEIIDTYDTKHGPLTREETESCEDLKKNLEEKNRSYKERVSLSILANRDVSLEAVFDADESAIVRSFESIVRFLKTGDSGFQKELDEKREIAEKTYGSLIRALAKRSIEMAEESHEDLVYRLKLFRRIPFEVHFTNEKILKKLEEAQRFVSRSPETIKPDDAKRLSREILNLTTNESVGVERHLLSGILNYNFGQVENARRILANCLSLPGLERKDEWILLELLALHRSAIERGNALLYQEARDRSRQALKENPGDARFSYLYGVTVGRGVESGLEKELSLDDVLAAFRNAVPPSNQASPANKFFSAIVWNNIAYAICLKKTQTPEELRQAWDAMTQVSLLVPEEEWNAQFLDTKGVVHYLRALHEADEGKRKSELIESRSWLDKAVKSSRQQRYFKSEIKGIEENRRRTMMQLKLET